METQQTYPGPDLTGAATAGEQSDLATAQCAMHLTRLAVARWSSGHTYMEMQVAAALRPSSQARWYQQTQDDFRAWLQEGGFHRPDTAAPPVCGPDSAPTPAPAAPDGLAVPAVQTAPMTQDTIKRMFDEAGGKQAELHSELAGLFCHA